MLHTKELPLADPRQQSQRGSFEAGEARADFVRQETLAKIFAQTATRYRDAIALVDENGSLTYGELDTLADGVAAGLRERGARAGQSVGLWLPRGRDVLIAQIAIAKTGAAWVPFDAAAPAGRVLACLRDVDALGVITSATGRDALPHGTTTFLIEHLPRQGMAPVESDAGPDHAAYVIYTSGSTGIPKGVIIRHRNICHFLRAAADLYAIGPDDRMLQCCSVAFDLSLEEIWLPILVGARLVVCAAETLADPERLATFIDTHSVTAMDVVPTLLSLVTQPLPTVRLIIVGGEACPESVVNRFATDTCRLINSYGPTEATVVATAARLMPSTSVTIGRPLANMTCYVVDEQLSLVSRGTRGELLLGGPGIAEGYLQRPELTAAKFITNTIKPDGADTLLYRTGDAVVMGEDGNLSFHGRVDDQVKIRGFRVELGEIETLLARQPGVEQAAVIVHREAERDQLVGFVVQAEGTRIDTAAVKDALRHSLPSYMMPTVIVPIAAMPRLTSSGKIDRNALSAHPLTANDRHDEAEQPATPTEAMLLDLARTLFPGQRVELTADFFLEMGGHSLLAAQFVSAARREGRLRHMTLGQVYEGRTLRGIAALLDSAASAGARRPLVSVERASAQRRFWCGIAQLAVTPLLLTLMSAPWLAIFITYDLVTGDNSSLGHDIVLVFLAYALVNVVTALLVVAAKWAIIGRTRPGIYPLWGSYYFRVWLVQRLLSLVHLKWMQNTPVLRGYLRLLGVKVGSGALISDFDAGALDLVEFGANAATGSKVVFANARIEGAHMHVGRIRIGDDAIIGSSCAIEGEVEIGEGTEIADLTSLACGARIPAWQRWSGAPARQQSNVDPQSLPNLPAQATIARIAHYAFYSTALALLPAVSILPIVPAFRLMEWLDTFINPVIGINYLWYMPVLALSAAAGMIAATLVLVVACRWLVLPRVRPGRYAVTSGFYLRRWAIALLIEAALDTLSTLFATLYMRVWYRAMGSRIGKGSEISTSFAGRYELIELGADNFIADDVVLGDDSLRRGWLTLEPTQTGDRVFIGNEAVVPQGSVIGEGALIGVRSCPPETGRVGADETWFGSPGIQLPVRQRFDHDARQTYKPKRRQKFARALFEAFNISLPTALFITLVTIVMEILAPVFDRQNWGKAIWICVAASTLIAVIQLFVAVVYKWLLMGRYRPTMKPMWSWWALRTEAVAVMYWGMAGKALLDVLRGTPFLPLALRLFGVRTGRGIYLDSADITEFDCVTIGDDAVLNNHAVLQTHLYEDRLMKVGRIEVGEGAVIGAGSTVLYDTLIGKDATLGPLTLVMKGEVIPPNSEFSGSPAQPRCKQ